MSQYITASAITVGESIPNCTLNENIFNRMKYAQTRLITSVYLNGAICFPGVTISTLAVVVLLRHNTHSTTNAFLCGLAASDTLLLLTGIHSFSNEIIRFTNERLAIHLYYRTFNYLTFAKYWSVSISSWMVLCIAAERFMFINHPIRVRLFYKRRHAVWLSYFIYIFMAVLSFPYLFHTKTQLCYDNELKRSRFEWILSDMWKYRWWLYLAYITVAIIVRYLIPLILLMYMNFSVISSMRFKGGHIQRQLNRVSYTLAAVIIVFFLCVSPDSFASIIECLDRTYLTRSIREVTDVLLMLNATCNSIIYFLLNPVSRRGLLRLLCPSCVRTSEQTVKARSADRKKSSVKKETLPIISIMAFVERPSELYESELQTVSEKTSRESIQNESTVRTHSSEAKTV